MHWSALECVSEFISFDSEAAEKCQMEKRKTNAATLKIHLVKPRRQVGFLVRPVYALNRVVSYSPTMLELRTRGTIDQSRSKTFLREREAGALFFLRKIVLSLACSNYYN